MRAAGMRDALVPRGFRFAEDRVLTEQIRLVCGHVQSSAVPTALLLCLAYVVLATGDNHVKVVLWCTLAALSKLATWLHARQQRPPAGGGVPALAAHPRREARTLMLLHAADGLVWGALPWVALDPSQTGGALFIAAVLTGVAANSMSLLSPVVPVSLAFMVCELGLGAIKFIASGSSGAGSNSGFVALGVAGLIYAFSMIGQCFNSARIARSSIDLRFENIELLSRLREETRQAEEAREQAEDARRQAESARHEAEDANLAKSRFLAAASHDLRQPVHAQGLFLEVLSQTPLTAHQADVLASARSASLASSDMLNTLLDFSRIEAGAITPQPQPFLLQNLLHAIENDLAPMADAKDLIYRSRETSVTLHSDPSLVEMVLRNLISNAIRYTEMGGVLVACRVRAASREAVVEVWDTGIGIAAENQQDIFREFHQLGNPERDHRRGLGLGLAIAEGLARALGSRITLRSRPGLGTVFRLALPLSTAVARPAPPPLTGGALLDGLRVLVIDDDEAVRAGMVQLLNRWGCEVVTAEGIDEALALARVRTPDIVISDYRLRGPQTGAEVIALLRQSLRDRLPADVTGEMPALMVTGDTAPERLREALATGVPLLHKPVAPGELYRAMVRATGCEG